MILCRLLLSIFPSIRVFPVSRFFSSLYLHAFLSSEQVLQFTLFACISHRALLMPLVKSCVEFLSPVLRVQSVASGGQVQVEYSYIYNHNKKTTLLEFVLNQLVPEAYRKCSTKYCWLFSN